MHEDAVHEPAAWANTYDDARVAAGFIRRAYSKIPWVPFVHTVKSEERFVSPLRCLSPSAGEKVIGALLLTANITPPPPYDTQTWYIC